MNETPSNHMRPIFRVLLCAIVLFVVAEVAIWLFGFYASAQREAVAEAVVRNYLRETPAATVAFDSLDGADPSRAFLRKFAGNGKIVRAISQDTQMPNRINDSWLTRYQDKATKQQGVLLAIGEINWTGFWLARVSVWLPGHQDFYLVRKTSRGWIVADQEQGIVE